MREEFEERGGRNLEKVMVEAFSEPPDANEIVESAVKNNNLGTDEQIRKYLAGKAAKITGLNSQYQRTKDPQALEKMFNVADDMGLLKEFEKIAKR